jgi:hypothetical protein
VTVVDTRVTHDWRLVAPWWHWPRRDGLTDAQQAAAAEGVRRSAPVLQKYDGPDLVNTFLADPQHRMAFRSATDQVHTIEAGANGLGSLPCRKPTGRRKLFLGSHHRHYLVVASLHCSIPGFPTVERDGACEAGFVVRRQTVALADDQRKPAAALLTALAAARRRRAAAEAQVEVAGRAGRVGAMRLTALQGRLRTATGIERDAAAAVQAWASATGVTRQLLGWVPQASAGDGSVVPLPPCPGPADPRPLAGVGKWTPVTELPDEVTEATYPLTPLIADETRPDHDATGETIWFGVVPTGSSDVDPGGAPRYDDRWVYEVRCFVRRHRPECPRDGSHCGCPVTWSEPTEPYQLASQNDLEGTANRPVTVQLPDLAQLQADAIRLGPGGVGGVRFQYPPDSALGFSTENTDATQKPGGNDFQICSFSIPLITIVATFVFKLFLPIVMFVFQLWFLLALKFCIPPDVEIAAGGDLDLAFSELGVGLEIDVDVAARFGVGGDLQGDLATAIAALLADNKDRDNETLANRFMEAMTSAVLDTPVYAALARASFAGAALPPPDRVPTEDEPVFAPRVERHEVVVP